jgi:hypothetical protein
MLRTEELARDRQGALLAKTWRFALRYGAQLCLCGYLIFLIIRVLILCDGSFSYALDDAYIHMGLARSLAENGIWGVGDGFASAASSILWPATIALIYWIKGADLWTPLVLEWLGIFALLAVVHARMRKDFPAWARRGWPGGIAALAVALSAPVNTLILSGLEHIWHLVAVIWYSDYVATQLVKTPGTIDKRSRLLLIAAAPLLTIIRFETLALVPVIAGLLVLRRAFATALGVAAAAGLPILFIGWISQAQGGFFWPNSLVLKAIRHAPGQPIATRIVALFDYLSTLMAQHHAYFGLLVLAGVQILCFFAWKKTVWSRTVLLLILFFTQSVAHASFGGFGWLFRYEAYVLAFGVFANLGGLALLTRDFIFPGFVSPGQRRWPSFLVFGLVLALASPTAVMIARRTRDATRVTPRAAKNIFEQQVQFAHFLKRYYPQASIALNDIGAAAYYSDAKILDLVGLGSNEVAHAKIDGQFTTEAIERLSKAHGVEIAIVYDSWFAGALRLPPSWSLVGQWEIRGNVVCGSPIVSFYAVQANALPNLERNLAEFAYQVPATVIQRGRYLAKVEGLTAGSTVLDRNPIEN